MDFIRRPAAERAGPAMERACHRDYRGDRSIDKHYCDVSGGVDAIFLLYRTASRPLVYSPVTVRRVSLASNC